LKRQNKQSDPTSIEVTVKDGAKSTKCMSLICCAKARLIWMMSDKVPADTRLSTLLYLCVSESRRESTFKDQRFSDGTKKYAFNDIVPANRILHFVVSGIFGVFEFPVDFLCV
jgi:hypothetical protein